jgi:tRNA(Ile)-lysidine synthase TilS/MesJ
VTQAAAVALAHHADDQVELFFLRLFRGAGVEGLAGMNWAGVSPEDSSHSPDPAAPGGTTQDLAQFARDQRIEFREDSSNRSLDIGRNRIRHALLPMLRRRYQVALDSVILRTMATLRDTAAWTGEAGRGLAERAAQTPFRPFAHALQRQILSLQLRELEVPVASICVERLRLHARRADLDRRPDDS